MARVSRSLWAWARVLLRRGMNLAAQDIWFPLCCTLFTKPNTPLGGAGHAGCVRQGSRMWGNRQLPWEGGLPGEGVSWGRGLRGAGLQSELGGRQEWVEGLQGWVEGQYLPISSLTS